MAFSRVTRTGLGGNLGKSIGQVGIGLVLFIASFGLLWWNEGRAVKRAQDLEEGLTLAVSVGSEQVEAGNEGKLVHTNGLASTDEVLVDTEFGVSAQALRLQRTVEMYQYKERVERKSRKKIGGGSETVETYYYDETWAENVINSDSFKDSSYRGANPKSKPIDSKTQQAAVVSLGAFSLRDAQVERISDWKPVPPAAESTSGLAVTLPGTTQTIAEGWFAGQGTPSSPQIGDLRITFRCVLPTEISVIARQIGQRLEPWPTSSGDVLDELKVGLLGKDAMFQKLQEENAMLTWILRFVGFVMMAIGLGMLFSPLVALADIVPFVGSLVGAGVMLFAGVAAAGLSLLTIAVAWIAYRPLIGIPLLLAAVVCLVLVVRAGSRRRRAQAQG